MIVYQISSVEAFKIVDKENDLSYLEAFTSKTSTHDQIASAGEEFLLSMYNAPKKVKTLDDLRYEFYTHKKTNKKSQENPNFENRFWAETPAPYI